MISYLECVISCLQNQYNLNAKKKQEKKRINFLIRFQSYVVSHLIDR